MFDLRQTEILGAARTMVFVHDLQDDKYYGVLLGNLIGPENTEAEILDFDPYADWDFVGTGKLMKEMLNEKPKRWI